MLAGLLALSGATASRAAIIGLADYALDSLDTNIGDAVGDPVPDAVTENLSGVTFNANSGSLFTVINSIGGDNSDTAVVELSTSGSVLRSISLTGFEDIEGIVHLGGNRFGIVEERRRNLVTIPIGGAITTLDRSIGTVIPLGTPGTASASANSGLEGVSYDPNTDDIYVVWEKSDNPGTTEQEIRSFDLSTAELSPGVTPSMNDPFANGVLDSLGLIDLSGLHFNSVTNTLLIISHESDELLEVSPTGTLLSSISLTGPNQMNQPEGVTMGDDGRLYIVGEADELAIYVGPEPAIPEPSTFALVFASLACVLRRRRG